MFGFIALLRTVVLASALAWLGLEFASDHDKADDTACQEPIIVSMLG